MPQASNSHGSFLNTFRRYTRRRALPRRDPTTLSLEAAHTSGGGGGVHKFQHERIVGRDFAVVVCTKDFDQLDFYPYVLHGISVCNELNFGMPALFFDKCTAPIKLPLRECSSRRRLAASSDHLREETGSAARLRAFFVRSFSLDVSREVRSE